MKNVESDLAENVRQQLSTVLINPYFRIFLRTLQVQTYTDIMQNFLSNTNLVLVFLNNV